MNWQNIQITPWRKISKIEMNTKYVKSIYLAGEDTGVVEIFFSLIIPNLNIN
jgi:hypothetical protein